MADDIDVVVRDKISANVRRKILNIARASEIADVKVAALKTNLNFGGLNLGLRKTGISNMAGAIQKLQGSYATLAAQITTASHAQEFMLDKLIVSEAKAEAAVARRMTAVSNASAAVVRLKAAEEKSFFDTAAAEERAIAANRKRTADAVSNAKIRLSKEIAADEKMMQATERRVNAQISDEQRRVNAFALEEAAYARIQKTQLSLQSATERAGRITVQQEQLKVQAINRTTQATKLQAEVLKRAQSLTANQSTRNRNKTNALSNRDNIRTKGLQDSTDVRLATQEAKAIAAAEVKKRNEYLKTAALRRKLGSDVARIIALNNNRVINSTNSVIVKEQSLVAALDKSSVGYKKMAQAGLAAEAAQNRVAAAQTRLSGPTKVVAQHTTTLSKKQIKAAGAAADLAIKQNNASISAIRMRKEELSLATAFDRSTGKVSRNTAAVNKNNAATRASSGPIRGAITNLRNLLAVYGGFQLFSTVGEGLDTFVNVNNRLKSVTTSADNLLAVQAKLFDIANGARVPVLGLATAYQRFDKALVRSGASQEEVLNFTETFTKQLKLAGTSAQETESVMVQLGQALTKGNLDGEELRALRENAPIDVMEAFADVLGVGIDQIKEMGRQQLITTDVIRAAAVQLRKPTLDQFGRQVVTISEALSVFRNKFTVFLRDFNESTGVFTSMGNAILWVGNNLENIYRWALLAGTAFVAYKAGAIAVGVITVAVGVLTGSVTALGTATAFATGGLSLIAAAAAIGVGGLIAYSDQIEVSKDGTIKLADVFEVEYGLMSKVAADVSASIIESSKNWLNLEASGSFVTDAVNIFKEILINGSVAFDTLGVTVEAGFDRTFKSVSLLMEKSYQGLLQRLGSFTLEFEKTIANIANLVPGINITPGAVASQTVGVALAGSVDRVKQLELDLSNSQSNMVVSIANSEKTIRAVVEANFKARADLYKNTADTRIDAAEDAKRAIIDGEKEIRQERTNTTKSAIENSKTTATQLRNQWTAAEQASLEYSQSLSATNAQTNQLNSEIGGIADSFADSRQVTDDYFNAMSEGYTNLISQSAEFSQRAQTDLSALGTAIGNLGSDEGNFGEVLLALYNFGVNSASADFTSRLAAAGPGVASNRAREDQSGGGDAQAYAAVASSAQQATPLIAALNQQISGTSAALANVGQTASSIQYVSPNASSQISSLSNSYRGVQTAIKSVGREAGAISFATSIESASQFGTSASSSLGSVSTASGTTSTSINRLPEAFNASRQSVTSFATTAVSELQKVTEAANKAADAQSRVGSSGGGGGGGGFLGGLFGFNKGGYTGNGGRNEIAGVVHGQEFVMPAAATAQNRPILEAMRDGRSLPTARVPVAVGSSGSSGEASGQMVVTVNNFGNDNVKVNQLSSGEVEVMIGEAMKKVPAIVANDLNNSNGKVSKGLRRNTTAGLKR